MGDLDDIAAAAKRLKNKQTSKPPMAVNARPVVTPLPPIATPRPQFTKPPPVPLPPPKSNGFKAWVVGWKQKSGTRSFIVAGRAKTSQRGALQNRPMC